MIEVIIIDDEPAARELIESLVNKFTKEATVVASIASKRDAIEYLERSQPSIIFLDVELADGTGFDILEKFPDINSYVIFITAYEHYSLKAIKHNAFDYILKPVDLSEFSNTLLKAIDTIKSNQKKTTSNYTNLFKELKKRISVPTRTGYMYYDMDDIICLEADGSYTKLHLTGGRTVLISKGLAEVQASLANTGFLRVHKSFLINLQHIVELRKDDGVHLMMSDNKYVPIGSKYKEEVMNLLRSSTFYI